MRSRYFHPGNKEGTPGYNKRLVSAFEEQQDGIGKALILTTEGIECEAVCAHLSNLREEIHRGTLYKRGTFLAYQQKWDVSIIEIGEEGLVASQEAERAIGYCHPDVILFISVAYGLHDVYTGDVVSATKVYAYEPPQTFQTTPPVWNIRQNMEQQARAEATRLSWLQRIKGSIPALVPDIVFAPVVSGEKEVPPIHIAASEISHTHDKDAVAVEMGRYGVLQAARTKQAADALVVCGIAEIIQEQSGNDEDWRRIAAQHACAFAFEVLARLESKVSFQPPQRTETTPPSETTGAIEIFYSYVDADEKWVKMLRGQLVMLERSGQISNWYAGKMTGGENLDEHLRHLETARLILLLVSPEYLASDPHYNVEVKRAMERQKTGDATVVPIILRPTSGLQHTVFRELLPIPRAGKAVVSPLKDLDQAFKDVADKIVKIVKTLKNSD